MPREEEKHSEVRIIKAPKGRTQRKVLDIIQKKSQELGKDTLSYDDLPEELIGSEEKKRNVYRVIRDLGEKGLIIRPKKGRFGSVGLLEKRKEPLESRKILLFSKIDKGLEELRPKSEAVQKELQELEEKVKELRKESKSKSKEITRLEKMRRVVGAAKDPDTVDFLEEALKSKT